MKRYSSFLLVSLPAFAASEIQPQLNAPRLEEVIVSAQKRDESLMSVPIAMDVIGQDFLEGSGAVGLSEIEAALPSVNFGRGGRKTRGEIAIRGVGDFARNIGTNGRAVVYIDDVPLGRSSAFDASLIDVKQIEVLKGPQGTLFGTNTVAGAINITTQAPGDTFATQVQTDAGERGYRMYSVKTNIPMGQTISARVQLNHKDDDGHIDNIAKNTSMQGSDLDAARLKLAYSPTEQTRITVSSDWLRDSSEATNAEALAGGGHLQAPEPRQVSHNANENETRKLWGSSINVAHTLASDAEVRSITALRRSQFSELSEEDYSSTPLATSTFDEAYKQWSQELRYSSPINDNLDYVVGVFFHNSETSTSRSAVSAIPGITGRVITPGQLNGQSIAMFGNFNFRFNDHWELTTGLRVQREEKEIEYAIDDTTGLFAGGPDATDIPRLNGKKSFAPVLPRIGLNYESPSIGLIYASIGRGTKSGGWNADFVGSLDDLDFDEEYATNYELGYKNSYFDKRLSIMSAMFYTQFSDFQVLQTINSDIRITNAAKAATQGVELSLNYQPTNNLHLQYGTAYVEAEFKDFDNVDGAGTSYDGNQLPYAPEWSHFLATDFDFAISNNIQGLVHVDVSYSDEYFSQPRNSQLDKADSHYLVNAYIGFTISEMIDLRLWGKNITDEEILRFRDQSFLGIQRGYYETPRTIGISAKLTFGDM